MDYSGKRTDVVDIGGEMDYADYQWFQDAPPKAQVSRLAGFLTIHLTYSTKSHSLHSQFQRMSPILKSFNRTRLLDLLFIVHPTSFMEDTNNMGRYVMIT